MSPPRFVSRTFKALRKTWFRWFWAGRTLSSAAFRIRGVVRGWLVYEITGSALALGWVSAAWGLATFLFSLLGGTASDRVNKRRVLIWGQAIYIVIPLSISALIFLGCIRVWHLGAGSFLMGVLFSFMIPARRALLTDLTSDGGLMNAMALSTVGMSLVGVLSFSAAGWLIEQTGPAIVYLIMAALLAVTTLFYIQLPDSDGDQDEEEAEVPLRDEIADGLRYVVEEPELVALLGLELGRVLLYRPYMTLLPVFAADVFQSGAFGLGLLRSAGAVGGMLGSLGMAALGDTQHKGRLLLGMGILSGIGLILLGGAPSFGIALLCRLIISFAGSSYMVNRSTLLQSLPSDHMRGRMVGFRRLVWGMMPLGALPIGALADAIGAPLTVILEGVGVIALFGLTALLKPRLRTLS